MGADGFTVEMLKAELGEPKWHEATDGLWEATLDNMPLGSIEETRAYGFVVKNSRGDWLASFSVLENAMWFLHVAERATWSNR
ncbi:hypothetical protein BHD05_00780 [Marisediminicola antarctica]|uniref:Uncharacterized protein n=2 Tax=Marisediminicola antarctica TaxID=674079 RepID=A0A7L5AH47_9MICO|nr:hypothetical protein BHD05_00780 [Marisediminicola antarctica]